MTGRRFAWLISWLIAAAIAIGPAAAPAADLPSEPKSAPAPAGPSILAPPDTSCLEWTDGCRTCQKLAPDSMPCSNVGIACVPQPPRCLRR
jgi:hypothetical protein